MQQLHGRLLAVHGAELIIMVTLIRDEALLVEGRRSRSLGRCSRKKLVKAVVKQVFMTGAFPRMMKRRSFRRANESQIIKSGEGMLDSIPKICVLIRNQE